MHVSFQFSNCWHFIHCVCNWIELEVQWAPITIESFPFHVADYVYNGNHDLYNYCGISESALMHVSLHIVMPMCRCILVSSTLFEWTIILDFDFDIIIWRTVHRVRLNCTTIWKIGLERLYDASFCTILNSFLKQKINELPIRDKNYVFVWIYILFHLISYTRCFQLFRITERDKCETINEKYAREREVEGDEARKREKVKVQKGSEKKKQ